MKPSERIEALRNHALSARVSGMRSAEGELLFYRGWEASAEIVTPYLRRAHARAFQMCRETPVIDEGELIVGKPCYRELAGGETRELSELREELGPVLNPGGQASHMAIDYGKLLRLGLGGIRREIRGYLADTDGEKREFYEGCLVALDGAAHRAERYAEHAGELASGCADPERRKELEEIASVLERVPEEPARTFREALQSVHFVTFILEGLYQLGRPDRYLIDFYRRDLAAGVLTEETAQELIDCACVLFDEYVPRGLAVGFMVGGTDASGRDVCNELTRLFLRSIGHTRMIYPGIGLCCTPDTPEDIVRLSCDLLAAGHSHPALFNDRTIVRGLSEYGLPAEEACLYVHSTCVEITPIAGSAVWVASPYINLVQLLHDLIGVPPTGTGASVPAGDYADFDALVGAYRTHLGEKVAREAEVQNGFQEARYERGGDPLVSCFVNDCLPRGLDVDRGGARHNWIMPSFVGMANLVDSLVTVRHLVFEERSVTLRELAELLADDFRGAERFRLRILNTLPKYGNQEDEPDGLAREVTGWIREETAKHRTFRGDRFIPSLFCWIQHERLGSLTAASADGRRAGFPLGDGSGPAQGRERKGPTASILSSTCWNHAPFIGGIAVNLKFGGGLLSGGSEGSLENLVRTFMDRGGFELQVNVVDSETLVRARKHPEQYRDLVVRIGGYSDYFVKLTDAMQQEVIHRTEHAL